MNLISSNLNNITSTIPVNKNFRDFEKVKQSSRKYLLYCKFANISELSDKIKSLNETEKRTLDYIVSCGYWYESISLLRSTIGNKIKRSDWTVSQALNKLKSLGLVFTFKDHDYRSKIFIPHPHLTDKYIQEVNNTQESSSIVTNPTPIYNNIYIYNLLEPISNNKVTNGDLKEISSKQTPISPNGFLKKNSYMKKDNYTEQLFSGNTIFSESQKQWLLKLPKAGLESARDILSKFIVKEADLGHFKCPKILHSSVVNSKNTTNSEGLLESHKCPGCNIRYIISKKLNFTFKEYLKLFLYQESEITSLWKKFPINTQGIKDKKAYFIWYLKKHKPLLRQEWVLLGKLHEIYFGTVDFVDAAYKGTAGAWARQKTAQKPAALEIRSSIQNTITESSFEGCDRMSGSETKLYLQKQQAERERIKQSGFNLGDALKDFLSNSFGKNDIITAKDNSLEIQSKQKEIDSYTHTIKELEMLCDKGNLSTTSLIEINMLRLSQLKKEKEELERGNNEIQ